jgi:hypothetical protein
LASTQAPIHAYPAVQYTHKTLTHKHTQRINTVINPSTSTVINPSTFPTANTITINRSQSSFTASHQKFATFSVVCVATLFWTIPCEFGDFLTVSVTVMTEGVSCDSEVAIAWAKLSEFSKKFRVVQEQK